MYNLTQLALIVSYVYLNKIKKIFLFFKTDIMNECPTSILFAQQLTHIELVFILKEIFFKIFFYFHRID
jgi:hypothetical protein